LRGVFDVPDEGCHCIKNVRGESIEVGTANRLKDGCVCSRYTLDAEVCDVSTCSGVRGAESIAARLGQFETIGTVVPLYVSFVSVLDQELNEGPKVDVEGVAT
jgi:hypothetical protein